MTTTGPRTAGARVVVGVDGSRDSIAALRAGARAASALGATLVAVTAWGGARLAARTPALAAPLGQDAEDLLDRSLVEAFDGRTVMPLERSVRLGATSDVLLAAARGARLLVVGRRGRGGFRGLLLGSIGMTCVLQSTCPVLVMHAGRTEDAGTRARVVVGVDEAEEGPDAIRVAGSAARALGAELLAVVVLDDPITSSEVLDEDGIESLVAARRTLDRRIAVAFPDGGPPRVRGEVRAGRPTAVLVEESRHAALVVVARPGVASALPRSVCLAVAEYAEAPVLVVPTSPAAAPPPSAQPPAFAGAER